MTQVAEPAQAGFLLDRSTARALTDEVRLDAELLWTKLLELYEGGAHFALGYSSWERYFEAEFGGKSSHAYRLLDSARVVRMLDSPIGERPANEAQTRELAPLLDRPEQLREAWAEVVESHPTPTASDVREVVRSRLDVHYSSATDDWSTPQDLFDLLNAEFGFDVDVCATARSAKCERFFSPEDDGLAQDWRGVCWMNPPYGRAIGEWMAKAHASGDAGATVVCLVPARTDTDWWWDHARHGEVRFIHGRIRFGDAESGAPFPSALVVFGRPSCVKWWEEWPKV